MPVPVTVFSGTLDQAIGQALKGNSKDKLAMSKSEKTNAAWRLVISTSLSLNQLVEVSTISKPTIALIRKIMRHLKEVDPDVALDKLTWRDALRKFQGKEDEEFAPDPEWRDNGRLRLLEHSAIRSGESSSVSQKSSGRL